MTAFFQPPRRPVSLGMAEGSRGPARPDECEQGGSVTCKPWERIARVCGMSCLALALTACAARRPVEPPPPPEAQLVREVVADLKSDAAVNRPAMPGAAVPSARLVALSSAKVTASSPSKATTVPDVGTNWFLEPSLHNVEECAHCQAQGAVRISSEYGKRRDPKRRSTYRLHHGVDIRAPQGSPALAFKGGTVIRANRFSSYGLTVEIRQYDGMVARYAHLNKILVKKGEEVNAGTQVGEVGRTGRTTGPHLHFELLKDGVSHDPMQYLTRAEQVVRCLSLESAQK